MKKIIFVLFAIFFMCLGFFIVLKGTENSEITVNYINVKKAVGQFLAKFKSKNYNAEELSNQQTDDALLLLLSEKYNNPVFVQAWKNIALEEGLHLDTLTDSDFLDLPANHYHGIILADTIHKDISAPLSKKLISYVSSGGSLMLVYDAGTLNTNNDPLKRYPLMADLLGISCGKTVMSKCRTEVSAIGNNRDALSLLGVPPGKCMIPENNTSNDLSAAENLCAISSTEYGVLNYAHYIIYSTEESPFLLTTEDNQLIATVKSFGNGKILFINLPITYLWSQTDAMFLHVFLRYFAINMLQLPTLAAVPNAVGGIIMNLHVESIDALAGFTQLQKIGFFQQKPYSIDITAGPGLDTPNDELGLNVPNNKMTQNWMHYLSNLGNAIGSDGGWMHNYFCTHINDNNQDEFKNYILMNNEAIETVLGKKVLEYVPSCGNEPLWATQFLEQEGFLGYYSTANTGTAPTRNFRDGIYFDKKQLWSFPVLPFQKGACFRDFGRIGYSEQSVTQWLIESTQFVSSLHTSRLIYFHPPDILLFPQYVESLKSWLQLTKQLQNKGVFQWYTMVDLAQFLNERKDVSWRVEIKNGVQSIQASHPSSLKSQSWILFKSKCKKPEIKSGKAIIKENNNFWIVQAGEVKNLEFNCPVVSG